MASTPPIRRVQWCFTAVMAGVLLAATFATTAQRQRAEERQASPALQRAVMDAAAKYHIPGMAIAVVNRGHITNVELFGVSDQASHAPVTAHTVFEADTLGEPLFAYAILKLAAEGRLELGVPLTKYLPLPYMRDLDPLAATSSTEPIYDPRLNQVSAIRVLNHTAGFPDWARNDHLRLQATPGQQWSYSDEGEIYLQHVAEQVTEMPAADFLKAAILGPAGMAHSGFVWPEDNAAAVATGYDHTGSIIESDHYARPGGPATFYTTIEDYGRFVAILLASAPAQREHESVVSLMLNPTVIVDESKSFSWGLGCGLEKDGEDVFFFDRGVGRGFQSFFMASRTTGTGVVILTNSGNGLAAAPELIAATIGGNHPVLKSDFLRAP